MCRQYGVGDGGGDKAQSGGIDDCDDDGKVSRLRAELGGSSSDDISGDSESSGGGDGGGIEP